MTRPQTKPSNTSTSTMTSPSQNNSTDSASPEKALAGALHRIVHDVETVDPSSRINKQGRRGINTVTREEYAFEEHRVPISKNRNHGGAGFHEPPEYLAHNISINHILDELTGTGHPPQPTTVSLDLICLDSNQDIHSEDYKTSKNCVAVATITDTLIPFISAIQPFEINSGATSSITVANTASELLNRTQKFVDVEWITGSFDYSSPESIAVILEQSPNYLITHKPSSCAPIWYNNGASTQDDCGFDENITMQTSDDDTITTTIGHHAPGASDEKTTFYTNIDELSSSQIHNLCHEQRVTAARLIDAVQTRHLQKAYTSEDIDAKLLRQYACEVNAASLTTHICCSENSRSVLKLGGKRMFKNTQINWPWGSSEKHGSHS